MTRDEFIRGVSTWGELIDFCHEYNCDVCEEIYDEDAMDDEINYAVSEYAGNYSWYELRDKLSEIPTGYNCYRRNDRFDWDALGNDDFEEYKDSVIEWMDDGGHWDEDDEDEEVDFFAAVAEVSGEGEQEQTPNEDFTVGDLIGMCSMAFATIQKNCSDLKDEDDADLIKLLF